MNRPARSPERARVLLVAGLLPLVVATSAWALSGVWNQLPAELPAHWSGSGTGAVAATPEVIRGWVLFGYASALCSLGVAYAAVDGFAWSRFGQTMVSLAVGLSGAIAFGLNLQLILADSRTVEQVVAMGFAPTLLGLVVGFGGLFALTHRLLPTPRNE